MSHPTKPFQFFFLLLGENENTVWRVWLKFNSVAQLVEITTYFLSLFNTMPYHSNNIFLWSVCSSWYQFIWITLKSWENHSLSNSFHFISLGIAGISFWQTERERAKKNHQRRKKREEWKWIPIPLIRTKISIPQIITKQLEIWQIKWDYMVLRKEKCPFSTVRMENGGCGCWNEK